MKNAKCTLDGKTYTASQFSTLPPNEQAHKRRHLVCPECEANAFFRKASRNGQTACFASRTHNENCPFLSSEPRGLEGGKIDDDVLHHSSGNCEIDLNVQANSPAISHHITLKRLLINLVNSIEFRQSKKKVKFQDYKSKAISEFFIPFDDAGSVDDNKVYGFWGVLSDARFDSEGSLWLNSGSVGEFSCLVPSQIVDDFYKYYNLEDEEEISGSYALILGTKKTSASGKSYVKLIDINHLTLRILDLSAALRNKFFINDKKKLEFLLRNHQKGIFDEELGIKKKHYIDKKAAKEWKIKILKELHPDKNKNDTSLDFDEVTANINKIYNRMVGKA
tara:strand:+ start:374 stop:1378 length:1005 start_codon:yes stop_codon:yes gene_type:complete